LQTGELQLRHALDFGEKHNRRAFLGDVYYQQVQDMESFVPPLQAADFSRSNLTHEQLHNLLRGYCSLSLFWKRFTDVPVPRRCPAPLHQSSWNDRPLWNDITTFKNSLDIRNGLAALRAKLTTSYPECGCREAYIEDLLSSIPDHFLGKAIPDPTTTHSAT
jgi:hypothetical protein